MTDIKYNGKGLCVPSLVEISECKLSVLLVYLRPHTQRTYRRGIYAITWCLEECSGNRYDEEGVAKRS